MQDAMGFLLMFDVTSDQSLVSCRDWLEQLTTHAYTDSPDIVLCGTRSVTKVKKCFFSVFQLLGQSYSHEKEKNILLWSNVKRTNGIND